MISKPGRWVSGLLAIAFTLLCAFLVGCDLPQVRAQDRIFLNLSLDYLGDYQLADSDFAGTRVGGLSGLAYDRRQDSFYAISDDRSQFSPARFYQLKLRTQTQPLGIQQVEVMAVTLLKNQSGQAYAAHTLDPEGIAITPRRSVYISSEGVKDNAPPFVDEFDLQTGAWLSALSLPDYFLPNPDPTAPERGVGSNLGFESLTLNPGGDRLFVATESELRQDHDPNFAGPKRTRLLHYLLGDLKPIQISEHLYTLEPLPAGATFHGLVELLAVDNGGHFLSLERTFTPGQGISAKLFQISTGAATNISTLAILKGDLAGIQPVRKQLLLDLSQLGISLKNLEGMAIGPRLADGSQSLLLVSDNNFQAQEPTQFLLLRLHQGRQKVSGVS
jgi:hypothetical protein